MLLPTRIRVVVPSVAVALHLCADAGHELIEIFRSAIGVESDVQVVGESLEQELAEGGILQQVARENIVFVVVRQGGETSTLAAQVF